jgi:hypothetical protein
MQERGLTPILRSWSGVGLSRHFDDPWDSEGECRPFSGSALRPDRTSVPLDYPLHIGESDPGSLELIIAVQAGEDFEQAVGVLCIEPDTVVFYPGSVFIARATAALTSTNVTFFVLSTWRWMSIIGLPVLRSCSIGHGSDGGVQGRSRP